MKHMPIVGVIVLFLHLLASPLIGDEKKSFVGIGIACSDDIPGVYISEVLDASLTQGSNGLRPYDIIIDLNGRDIKSPADFLQVKLKDPTDAHGASRITIERKGARKTISTRLCSPMTPAQAKLDEGLHFYARAQYEQALNVLREGGQLEPNNAAIRKYMGLCYSRLKDYAQAKACLREALQNVPLNVDTRVLLADLYWAEGLLKDAEREYRTVIHSDANSVVAYRGLADMLVEQKKVNAAVELLRQAARQWPHSIGCQKQLYTLLIYQQKDYAGAIPVIQRLIGLDPRNDYACYNLGFCYWHLGQLARAFLWWDDAIRQHILSEKQVKELDYLMTEMRRLMNNFAVEILTAEVKPAVVAPGEKAEFLLTYRITGLGEDTPMQVSESRAIECGGQELTREVNSALRAGKVYATTKTIVIPRDALSGAYQYKAGVEIEVIPRTPAKTKRDQGLAEPERLAAAKTIAFQVK